MPSGETEPCLFTVFTPTYNRARTLHRVFSSLSRQTFRSFEWLVIDDGSSDGTRELIAAWRRHAGFPIRYLYQTNQGKHIAFNNAVRAARGELFLPLDSDDACVPDALERLRHHWCSVPPQERAAYAGVRVLCMDPEGKVVGDRFPQGVVGCSSLELKYRYKVTGEKWEFHRTDVLKEHPFPHVAGLGYLPESLVVDAIGRKYKTRLANEALRIYHRDTTPGSDSMLAMPAAKVARGKLAYNRAALNENWDWFWCHPSLFLRHAVQYARFSLHAGHGPTAQFSGLDRTEARLLLLLALPASLSLYWLDRLGGRRPFKARR